RAGVESTVPNLFRPLRKRVADTKHGSGCRSERTKRVKKAACGSEKWQRHGYGKTRWVGNPTVVREFGTPRRPPGRPRWSGRSYPSSRLGWIHYGKGEARRSRQRRVRLAAALDRASSLRQTSRCLF